MPKMLHEMRIIIVKSTIKFMIKIQVLIDLIYFYYGRCASIPMNYYARFSSSKEF